MPLPVPAPGWGMSLARLLVPSLPAGHPLAALDLAPTRVAYPFYFPHRASLVPGLSDRYLSLVMPVASYWYMALGYLFLDWARIPFFERYRIRDPNEGSVRNRVSLPVVAKAVLLQQCVQTIVGCIFVEPDSTGIEQVFRDHASCIRAVGHIETSIVARVLGVRLGSLFLHYFGSSIAQLVYWWVVPTLHLLYAFFILDTYQYWCHRLFHENRFLYRRVHSYHHKLIVTHAVGAIYNHWFEGLTMDTLSAVTTYMLCRLTVRQGLFVFTLSTCKTVNDHGGFDFPFWISPINCLWPNTIDYHDAHHQPQGFRFNFSQPYFIHWDEIAGTRMRPDQVAKMHAFDAQGKWKVRLPSASAQHITVVAKRHMPPTRDSRERIDMGDIDASRDDGTAADRACTDPPPVRLATSSVRDLVLTPANVRVRTRKHRSLPAPSEKMWGRVFSWDAGVPVSTNVLPYKKS